MDKATPINTRCRLFIRATSMAAMMAPRDSPPRSAPQILPTCSSVKPTFSTRAVLSTGTLTMTVYPTSAINIAEAMERQLSNALTAFFEMAVSFVIVSIRKISLI